MTNEPMPPTRAKSKPAAHYRELLRQTLTRQVLFYFLPLLLVAVFFHLQYQRLIVDSRHAHLAVVAEHLANTLDLFLRERVINLHNLIADPRLGDARQLQRFLDESLASLQKTSETFVDLGLVTAAGEQVAYAGPIRFPRPVNYSDERWFKTLLAQSDDWLVTDIYLGVRNRPHFTIAVRRNLGDQVTVLRAALSPEKIYEYLATLEAGSGVNASVVNEAGVFQVVTPRAGAPLESSPFRPPRTPRLGHQELAGAAGGGVDEYAYAWLTETPWALAVVDAEADPAGTPRYILWATLAFFVLMGLVILIRARQLVGRQLAVEQHEAELSGQLVQAAKLASVGELAAGIAHEINNPLAIIAEEVGLLQDSLDPTLQADEEPLVLSEHLTTINDAVFRCRDITRKLLTFVRRTEVKLASHHVHQILDEVVDGMLANELQLADIEVTKDYDAEVPSLVTDRNQLVQVLVNLVKNAIDAMGKRGRLTLRTEHRGDRVAIDVRDTGCGMTAEQLGRVFMPFYTTKEPGKGTGLGLSVSISIIKSLGGRMFVDSAAGRGSTFTIELPYELPG